MENVEEQSKVLSTTTMSSPNTTTQNDYHHDNDGVEGSEHVINQNTKQQTLEILNMNANILDLTESSSVTARSETNDSCATQQQHQAELENHAAGPESENVATLAVEEQLDVQQAPVDLTSLNATQNIQTDNLEYQTEPFNLKIDALASTHSTAQTAENLALTENCNTLLDLHENSAPAEAEADATQQEQNVLALENNAMDAVAIVVDKKHEIELAPQESILDLRINNVNEDSKTPPPSAFDSDLTYQTRLSELKTENVLESRDSAFPAKIEQINEITKSPLKLNGSHRYSPTENCEGTLDETNFSVPIVPKNEEELADQQAEVNVFSSALEDNSPNKPTNNSFSNSFEETAEHGSDTFEEANNTESTNELNESRYSSSDSLNSVSTLKSSSSHQLVIDQPTEDDKVPPLRLKLKRKHRKSNSSVESTQPAKRANMETISTENLNTANSDEILVANSAPTSSALLEYTEPAAPTIEPQKSVVEPQQIHETTPSEFIQTLTPPQQNQAALCENILLSNSHVESLQPQEPPAPPPPPTAAAQYYKCTACGTFHENWSFFLHLQEKHDRFLCLYCIKCFPTAEKLALHLEIKHDLEQNHFNTEEAFRNSALIIHGFNLETRFLMCCTCQYIFRENAAFTEHACIEFMKSCLMCGQKGRHTNQCKANPLAKRRNKKKIRQKDKPASFEPTPQIEPMLKPPPPQPASPPPAVFNDLAATIQEPPQQQQPAAQKATPIRRQSEDSNSSSNMVIDESCNTNHSLLQINPFKALDDNERLEQQAEEAAAMRRIEAENLLPNNVFKFKLRVPKEFQKPVDEEISTSESENAEVFEDEANATGDINSNKLDVLEGKTTALTPQEGEQQEALNNEMSLPQSEEESVDETAANAHLARILQEIEQTKLDIEKTKETLHQRHTQQKVAKQESLTGESKTVEEVNDPDAAATPPTPAAPPNPVAAAEDDEQWTPTPPASPSPLDDTTTQLVPHAPNSNAALVDLPAETTAEETSQPSPTPAEDLPLPEEAAKVVSPPPPDDGIEVANEDCLLVELQLDRPLDQFETVEFVRICLKAAYPYCLYCNHARRIAVNAESLVLHLIAQHRFSATVDSITAEELQPSTLVAKLKSFLPELQDQYMNSSSYCTIGEGRFARHFNERIFECFQCRFVTSTHKELYLHNRKMHLRTAILCFMCRCNFYSFSEILCHICPGVPHRVSIFEIKFRCCLCDLTEIPSPFRLMVHLRKRHFACDVCLEDCRDQSKLSSHVWKHKLHHLCYRCGIAYRNKLDITKHLFWKHGTESAICKRCLQKRWPHVYHFCVPPAIFSCDVCQLCFSKAMYLTVHKRLHQNDFRYACTVDGCQEKFISRKLLLKHGKVHETVESVKAEEAKSEDVAEQQQKLEAENEEEAPKEEKPDVVAEKEEAAVSEIKTETESIKNEQAAEKAATVETNAEVSATPSQEAEATTTDNGPAAATEQPSNEKKHKKRKKRAKESLEDLNLTAPNLSESGSSSESDSETKSNIAANQRQELALSPLSEHGEQKDAVQTAAGELTTAGENTGNVLDIWKNFLQAQQQAGGELQQFAEYTEDDYPAPKCLHVCMSDHDYCAMFVQRQMSPQEKVETSPKASSARQRNDSSSSEASSDDSSSSSSCSCGSNCSCSNGSSSSSSSGDSSDSSTVSASKKRLRKKSERSNRHRKSFSSSPLKPQHAQLNTSSGGENINVIDTDDNVQTASQLQAEADAANAVAETANLEPTINESDLETAESETDEEYYDEHPQKLATELLSQKRAQLMARTLLSPSHNFDIVENSRPSTPSLPEDVIIEKRQKKKKNKRERKSTSNAKMLAAATAANELHAYLTAVTANNTDTTTTELYNQANNSQQVYMQQNAAIEPQTRQLPPTNATIVNQYMPRMSEGSSCSDADNSLKRSKRQRRPNKFYGYTSDDESMAPAALGQSLIIGMRAYKPLPPPQLVWDKEDLPTPEKSILNVSKKSARQTSTPNTTTNTVAGEPSTKKKRAATHRKRSGKHAADNQKLPPIPRLKIRPALFNKNYDAKDLGLDYSSDSGSSDNEQQQTGPPPRKRTFPPKQSTTQQQAATTFLPRYPPNQQMQPPQQPAIMPAAVALPPPPAPQLPLALPPTPQTTVFNHKIPPALLPNPDFSTLQYFKANNIRYPIRPPAGARAAREGESVYCYCRCPYDEVSEMIACDGDSCLIEWFHFECVGIMLAPQGKWFCAECRPQYSEELYPTTTAANTSTNFT